MEARRHEPKKYIYICVCVRVINSVTLKYLPLYKISTSIKERRLLFKAIIKPSQSALSISGCLSVLTQTSNPADFVKSSFKKFNKGVLLSFSTISNIGLMLTTYYGPPALQYLNIFAYTSRHFF